MRARRAAAAASTALAATLALAACSPLDADPVPTLMETGPWLCDGIARVSVTRAIGEVVTPLQRGDWRTIPDTGFSCAVDGPNGTLDVEVKPLGEGEAAASGSADAVQGWRDAGGEPIADPGGSGGEGYVFGEPGQVVTAAWACTDRTVEVVLSDVWLDDRRDQRVDARSLLVSVLPYACRKLRVPDVDYSATSLGSAPSAPVQSAPPRA